MFESNFPPDKQSCGYTELWNAFKRITSGASAAEKTALLKGTAARVLQDGDQALGSSLGFFHSYVLNLDAIPVTTSS